MLEPFAIRVEGDAVIVDVAVEAAPGFTVTGALVPVVSVPEPA